MHHARPNDRPSIGCTDEDVPPIRNMHDVLSNRCRRAICYYLADRGEPVPVTTVVGQLTRWQAGPTPGGHDDGLDQWTRSRLYRSHMQAMADFGILGFDGVADTVWIPDDVTISVPPPTTRDGTPRRLDADTSTDRGGEAAN